MALDRDAAVRAFEPLAARLGQTVEQTAAGVHRIMNSHMADLLRSSTIERGHDPREFALFAYGGAAASHAIGYAAEAGVKGIHILGDATAFSALGMLTADLVHSFDRARPMSTPFGAEDFAVMRTVYDELRAAAEAQLEGEGEAVGDARFRRSLLLRFRAQVHEIELDVPDDVTLDAAGMERLIAVFHERYERTYGAGSAYPDAGVEITTFRLTATVPTSVRELPRLAAATGPVAATRTGERPAYFDGHGFLPTAVLRRRAARAGPSHRGARGHRALRRHGAAPARIHGRGRRARLDPRGDPGRHRRRRRRAGDRRAARPDHLRGDPQPAVGDQRRAGDDRRPQVREPVHLRGVRLQRRAARRRTATASSPASTSSSTRRRST